MIFLVLERLPDMKAYSIILILFWFLLFGTVTAETPTVKGYLAGKTGLVVIDQLQVISLGASCRGISLAERVNLVTLRLKKIFARNDFEARRLRVVIGSELVGLSYSGRWLVTADQVSAKHYRLNRVNLAKLWRENILNAWLLKKQSFSVISSHRGLASWYGAEFRGCRTASGDLFNETAFTAAHRSLSFGTMVKVTNLSNQRSVIVRINDRGPWVGKRVIDLSWAAARTIGITGVAQVKIEILKKQE